MALRPRYRHPRRHAVDAGSPLDETFWVAQSDGATSAAANWRIDDGSYRVVVMNADGSPGVDVRAEVSVDVPVLQAITFAGLIGGTVLLVIGVPLLVAGVPYEGDASGTARSRRAGADAGGVTDTRWARPLRRSRPPG